jgi:hypothetical protein
MITRLKISFINIVIALGVGVIVWWQWPEAMKSHTIGAGYDPGYGASVFLAVLMCGIPALLYAVAVHVGLTHMLFAPDELRAYRARRLAESITTTGSTSKNAAPSAQSGKHDFID